MNFNISFFSAIILLGAVQGVFLTFALLNVKDTYLAHRFLAILALVFSLGLAMEFLYKVDFYKSFPHFLAISEPVTLLYAPLAYLYIKTLTFSYTSDYSKKVYYHFVPFLLSYFILIPFFALDVEIKLAIENDMKLGNEVDEISNQLLAAIIGLVGLMVFSVVQIGVYLILSFRCLSRYSKRIKNQYSDIEKINLGWLKNILVMLIGLYILYLADIFLSNVLGYDELSDFLNLMIVIMIYTLGYLGLKQPVVFQVDKNKRNDAKRSNKDDTVKYAKSSLDTGMSTSLLFELLEMIKNDKPYLDGDLNLPQLSKQIGVSPNYLSQVINEQLNQNFYNFINYYRVQEAKWLMSENLQNQPSIIMIAELSGFNSKSAFYKAFKFHTDMTPSQFKKTLNPL